MSAPPRRATGAGGGTPFERQRILNEIYQTERNYVNGLGILCDLFYEPLQAVSRGKLCIIPPDQIKDIFCNIVEIRKANQKLFYLLQDQLKGIFDAPEGKGAMGAVTTIRTISVGNIFKSVSSDFKAYESYCVNYQRSMDALEVAEAHLPFKAFLDVQYANPKMGLQTLSDLLISPIQRICKYPLLFSQLLKHTEKGHRDYETLDGVRKMMEDIALKINVSKAMAENIDTLLQLQEKIEGLPLHLQLATPGRALVLEGPLVCKMGRKRKPAVRQVILTQDLLMLCKKRSSKALRAAPTTKPYRFYQAYDTSLLTAMECSDDRTAAGRLPFKVQNAKTKTTILLYARTEEERDEWMEEIARVTSTARSAQQERLHQAKAKARVHQEEAERSRTHQQMEALRAEIAREREARIQLEDLCSALLSKVTQLESTLSRMQTPSKVRAKPAPSPSAAKGPKTPSLHQVATKMKTRREAEEAERAKANKAKETKAKRGESQGADDVAVNAVKGFMEGASEFSTQWGQDTMSYDTDADSDEDEQEALFSDFAAAEPESELRRGTLLNGPPKASSRPPSHPASPPPPRPSRTPARNEREQRRTILMKRAEGKSFQERVNIYEFISSKNATESMSARKRGFRVGSRPQLPQKMPSVPNRGDKPVAPPTARPPSNRQSVLSYFGGGDAVSRRW